MVENGGDGGEERPRDYFFRVRKDNEKRKGKLNELRRSTNANTISSYRLRPEQQRRRVRRNFDSPSPGNTGRASGEGGKLLQFPVREATVTRIPVGSERSEHSVSVTIPVSAVVWKEVTDSSRADGQGGTGTPGTLPETQPPKG